MSLINTIMRRLVPAPYSGDFLRVSALLTSCSRSYMENFQNPKTGVRPIRGWMHQNKALYPEGSKRNYLMNYSEIKRLKKWGYESRMSTEGGRKMIMRRILRNKDVLCQ